MGGAGEREAGTGGSGGWGKGDREGCSGVCGGGEEVVEEGCKVFVRECWDGGGRGEVNWGK